jgi:hypothetical protein
MMYAIRPGLGDAQQVAGITQQAGGIASSVAAPAIGTALSSTGTLAAGSTILGLAPAVAVPIIGAALVGVTLLVTQLIKNSGCGVTCVETSQWANKAEPLLQQNLKAYQALPTPRTVSQQAAALANFDAIWNQLVQLCGQPGTGNAGVRCVSDRQAGACKWKNAAGVCFNWFSGYRDPIANDSVVPDSAGASVGASVGASLPAAVSTPIAGLPLWMWLAGAGLAYWAVTQS